MRNDRQEQEMKFTRRSLLLSAGGVVVFGALAARLYTLQILQAERYRLMSDDNQFNFLLVPPSRGRILDRFGEPLAENRDSYRVLIVPEQAGDLDATVEQFGRHGVDPPIAAAHRRRGGEEVRSLAGLDAPESLLPKAQQLAPASIEAMMQVGDEGERFGGHHAREFGGYGNDVDRGRAGV